MEPTFVPPPLPARPRGVVHLLAMALRRPGAARGFSLLSTALLVAAVAVLAYPLATDLWAEQQQRGAVAQFDDPEFQQLYREGRVPVGDGLTRLQIPKIGVDVLVVQGTTPAALRAGAGHYVDTPLPGEEGNVGIAGHRTTFGRPFNRMDELKPGDELTLQTPFKTYTYRVTPDFEGKPNPMVVSPTEVGVIAPRPGRWLTLTTCHPKGSAQQRLVLRLEQIGESERSA